MLGHLVTGLVLGVVTGLPIGMVNVTIVDAARRLGPGRAIGIGLGGAVADTIHVGLAFAGIGALLRQYQDVAPTLHAVSGAILVVYGCVLWRSPAPLARPDAGRARDFGRGAALGLSITLPNPAALAAWIVVVGALMPDAGPGQAVAAALGVGAGGFAWFSLLSYLARRGRDIAAPRAQWLGRAFAAVLVGYGVFSLARAATYIL